MLAKHIFVDNVYRTASGECRWVVALSKTGQKRVDMVQYVFGPTWVAVTAVIKEFAMEVVCNMTPPASDEPLLTAEQAAEQIGLRGATLARWRVTGTPRRYLDAGAALPFVRMPEGVRYRHRDVEAFRETLAAKAEV